MVFDTVCLPLPPQYGDQRVVGLDGRDDGDEALAGWVNHDVETLDGAHAEEREVAVFREDYLVQCREAFGGEDGVADVALDDALVSGYLFIRPYIQNLCLFLSCQNCFYNIPICSYNILLSCFL